MRNLDDPKPLGAGSFPLVFFWSYLKWSFIFFLFYMIIKSDAVKFDFLNIRYKFTTEIFFILYLSYFFGWVGAMRKNAVRPVLAYLILGAFLAGLIIALLIVISSWLYEPLPLETIIVVSLVYFSFSCFTIFAAWYSLKFRDEIMGWP